MAVASLYLKANGEVPCWCSPGEHHPILRVGPDDTPRLDFVRDVLNGPAFVRMRRELHAGRLPFDYCRGCSFLRNDGEAGFARIDPATFHARSIDTLQIESSFLCNVDCPLCVRLPLRKQTKSPPWQLDLALFRRLIDELHAHAIPVREIWFSGRGEPLMNPDFAAMVRYGKERLGSRVTAHTNGNFAFRDELASCGLDEIEIAFDGVDQESYARYRRGGRLERVARFAAGFAQARRRLGSAGPELVWKMVLFDWNSSDAALARAVAWAEELGLDRVLLMNTDTPGGISYRDGGERLRQIGPLAERLGAQHPKVRVEVHGYHSVYSALPEVEAALRLESSDGERTVVLGRLYNHLLEDKTVRVELRLQDESGGPDHRLVDVQVQLAERSELVESFAIPHAALPAGAYRVWVAVSDARTGALFSEAACDFERR
jgi:pyruvate-formate lyase-activating enzyme